MCVCACPARAADATASQRQFPGCLPVLPRPSRTRRRRLNPAV